MANPLNDLALPAARFIKGSSLSALSFPFGIVNNTTLGLPSVGPLLDFSGFNTFSAFVTITSLGAGNTFTVVLVTVDPETGTVLGSTGNATVISMAASATAAGTLYLPSYYSTLTGLVLPFYQMNINLVHAGGTASTVSVTALKFWLTNA